LLIVIKYVGLRANSQQLDILDFFINVDAVKADLRESVAG
jgi:hypothetical protein